MCFQEKNQWVVKCIQLTILCSCLSLNGFGQIYQEVIKKSKTKNFREIVTLIEDYYKDKDKGKGSGYKQFKRWEEFNRTRLDPEGNLVNISQLQYEELHKYKTRRSSSNARIASSASGSWVSLGPGIHNKPTHNGRINCVAVDPSNAQIIYAGSPSGGLWRSLDDGKSWSCLTDNISTTVGISSIVIDPTSPIDNRTLYILTGDKDALDVGFIGLFKSIDNGRSWQRLPGFESSASAGGMGALTPGSHSKLMMHPTNNNMLFFLTRQGIYKSVDAGLNWTLKLAADVNDMEFRPSTPSIIYASGQAGTYRSRNTGDTWLKNSSVPHSSRSELAVSPRNPYILYLLLGEPGVAGLYKSTDSGVTFTKVNTSLDFFEMTGWQYEYDLVLAVSPINSAEVYMGGITLYKSTNGGVSWDWQEMGHFDYHYLGFHHDHLYAGNDGGITRRPFRTETLNIYSEDLSNGFSVTQIYRFGVNRLDPSEIIIGTQDNGAIHVKNRTGQRYFAGDAMECFIDPEIPNIYYLSTQRGYLYKGVYMNGEHPQPITPLSAEGTGIWITPFTMDPNNAGVLFAGYHDLWKNLSRGDATWTNLTLGTIAGSDKRAVPITTIAVAPANSNVIYFQRSGGNEIFCSKDGGKSWTAKTATKDATRIVVSADDPNVLWLTYGGFEAGSKIFKSIDGGSTWINDSGTLPNVAAHCAVHKKGSNNGLYIGTDLGVFYKDDQIGDWIPFDSGMPYAIITDLEIVGSKIYASTYGRGAWVSDLYANTNGCAAVGNIERELWSNVTGSTVSSIPLHSPPSATSVLTMFEGSVNTGSNYGARIRGYICAPLTGEYIFWISSDDHSELWLSTDDDAANKVKVASVSGWTNIRQWTKYTTQQSLPINLQAGHKYYIEALHKEASGGDHVAVGWQMPDGTLERPIPGNRLSPFISGENNPPLVSITSPPSGASFSVEASINLTADASDTDGTIARVEFFRNGSKLGEDITSPYTFTWPNVSAGNYDLTAKATDNAGEVSVSDTVKIQVTSSCTAQGKMTREYWDNVSGGNVSDIPAHLAPTTTGELTIFEGPSNVGTNYGSRIRGYICAPATGNYIFWIASDDRSELWLSTDDDPANKVKIASVSGWTNARQWTKYTAQQSLPIGLKAGNTYYIEALHKEASGGDHVAVGWQLPGGTLERPIPGARLSPVTESASARTQDDANVAVSDANGPSIEIFPNPVNKGGITLTLMDVTNAPTDKVANFQIMALSGLHLYEEQVTCKTACNTISIVVTKQLPPGIYIVQAMIDRRRSVKKLFVN